MKAVRGADGGGFRHRRTAPKAMTQLSYQDWADRVVRLCGAVRAVLRDANELGLPAPRGGWVDSLFQKLEPQLTRSPFLVVAVTGGTNTGKSTVFNQLAGDYPLGKDGLPDLPLRVLEDDENIPPRPEEELADLERTDPGLH